MADFAKAMNEFNHLVKALSNEAAGGGVDWMIDGLEISSAIATVRGLGEDSKVESVVRAYADVGTSLEKGMQINRFSPKVVKPAMALCAIPNGKITAVIFETPEREVVIRPSTAKQLISGIAQEESTTIEPTQPVSAFGALKGRIQTLTSRGGLRFTMYDMLYDKAVHCYLESGHEDIMREVWGKLAEVEGLVYRDYISGRPLTVRHVENVIVSDETPESYSYRDACGVAPSLTGILPEDAIRRMRDE